MKEREELQIGYRWNKRVIRICCCWLQVVEGGVARLGRKELYGLRDDF